MNPTRRVRHSGMCGLPRARGSETRGRAGDHSRAVREVDVLPMTTYAPASGCSPPPTAFLLNRLKEVQRRSIAVCRVHRAPLPPASRDSETSGRCVGRGSRQRQARSRGVHLLRATCYCPRREHGNRRKTAAAPPDAGPHRRHAARRQWHRGGDCQYLQLRKASSGR